MVSIDAQLSGEPLSYPISTLVAHSTAKHPMKFALNAATKVAFFGDRYLHGYVTHQFAHHSGTELFLNARARQFSRY